MIQKSDYPSHAEIGSSSGTSTEVRAANTLVVANARIGEIHASVLQLNGTLRTIADKLGGSQPPSESKCGAAECEPDGVVPQLNENLRDVLDAVQVAHQNAFRISSTIE